MAVRAPEVEDAVVAEVVDLARRLRELPLRKSPSIAEVIDSARAASYLRAQTGGGPLPKNKGGAAVERVHTD